MDIWMSKVLKLNYCNIFLYFVVLFCYRVNTDTRDTDVIKEGDVSMADFKSDVRPLIFLDCKIILFLKDIFADSIWIIFLAMKHFYCNENNFNFITFSLEFIAMKIIIILSPFFWTLLCVIYICIYWESNLNILQRVRYLFIYP